MLRLTSLSASTVVALTILGLNEPCVAATPAPSSLLIQAEGLPKEFHEHFFDVPLAVRVLLNREVLGEAMVVLSRDERVTSLEFSDTRDSDIDAAERAKWQTILQKGVLLGACTTRCDAGLIATHYEQDLSAGALRSVSGTVQSDTYGTGLSGTAQLDSDLVNGDLQLQRSSYNHALSGSLNLSSNVAVGGSTFAMSGQQLGSQAAMIVDVESDVEAIELRADDLSGSSTILKPGRNLLPLTAYRDGTVQFDFQGVHVPAATIQPARSRYHLNKGGVVYQQVRVMKTLTLFGRLLDAQDQPLKGLHVLNHASRGVTEVDGFFSMELSAGTPTLEVVRGEEVMCRFALDLATLPQEGDVLMAGDLRCTEDTRVKLAKN